MRDMTAMAKPCLPDEVGSPLRPEERPLDMILHHNLEMDKHVNLLEMSVDADDTLWPG